MTTTRTIDQLDQDHTQWRACLEAIDELDSRVPDDDPLALEVHRHIGTVAKVIEHAITRNRQTRPETEQQTLG